MPYFFLSYSRKDAQDPFLHQFFDDLRREVATRGGIDLDDTGFLDVRQAPGADWSTAAGAALSVTKVFVPLYAPNYFTSSVCGQEWTAYHRRCDGPVDAAGIVPVWWLPVPGSLPRVVETIQHTRDMFSPEYRRYGLRYLVQNSANASLYQDFLVKFATLVIEAGKKAPSAGIPAPLTTERDAFGTATAVRPGPRTARIGGPKRVTYVVAAGTRDEMAPVRGRAEVYGDDWDDWAPYHPDCPEPIVIRAQGVATSHRMICSSVSATDDLFELLEGAEHRRELVVLIVDAWTAELPDRRALLSRLDGRRYGNTVLLVPGDHDAANAGLARDSLYTCLANWVDSGEPLFRDDIRSIEEFEEVLGRALIEVRSRIVKRADVARRVESSRFVSRPMLSGPGG